MNTFSESERRRFNIFRYRIIENLLDNYRLSGEIPLVYKGKRIIITLEEFERRYPQINDLDRPHFGICIDHYIDFDYLIREFRYPSLSAKKDNGAKSIS